MANNRTSHFFHAEAHALAGNLSLPFEQNIKKQAFVKLEGKLADLSDEERAQRNYFSQHGKNFRLEGIISYASAHTQVSGHRSNKHEGASVTLATSVVEDLNVLNVVTADRVVAQISTTHFPDEYSPEVTFLGTHFENLRIARHKAEPYLNLGLVGERPKGNGDDALYVRGQTSLMAGARRQYERLKEKLGALGEREKREIWSDRSWNRQPSRRQKRSIMASPETSLTLSQPRPSRRGKQRRRQVSAHRTESRVHWSKTSRSRTLASKERTARPVEIPPPAKSFGHVNPHS